MTSPRRGEVWLVDLGMAAKVRPALVISIPAEGADGALVTLVPHTTSPRQSRFEVAVSVSFLRVGVFDATESHHHSARQVDSVVGEAQCRSDGARGTSGELGLGLPTTS